MQLNFVSINQAMSDLEKYSDYGDIDESEEEALLRSDGDHTMDCLKDPAGVEDEHQQEDKYIEEYIQILGQLEENKYNYDNYVQLVEIAHKLLDLEKIRQSCELFASIYPLAPEIWLRWIKIEQSLSVSPIEIENLKGLFRRALADYFCSNVALEFAKLTFKLPFDAADTLWDELLSVYALDCMKGRQFFVLFRKYCAEKRDLNDKTTIKNMYIKELSIPLHNMEESYIEFKIFCEENKETVEVKWDEVDKKYNKAKGYLKKILSFEKKLSELDKKAHQARASLYKEYIKQAENFMDEEILQVINERMVTECCLNPDCWLNYIEYLEERGILEKFQKYVIYKQSPLDITNRALSNCTWSEKLYIKKMQITEKSGCSRADIQKIFENAIAAGYQAPEPMVTLWLEYLSYLKRHTNLDDETEVGVLRSNFDFAWNSLGKQWGVLADCDCQILQFWGRLEYEFLGNYTKGKELWSTVMTSSDNSSRSGLWIEFAHLELKKDIDGARRIFRKALNENILDNPHVIVFAWLRFERCYGTLDQLISCKEQCEKMSNKYNWKLNKSKLKEDSSRSKTSKRKTETNTDTKVVSPFKKPKLAESGYKAESGNLDQSNLKSKTAEQSRPVKEHENEEIDLNKDHRRIFLSNLDYNITEEELRAQISKLDVIHIDIIKAANGRGRGFAYAELKSEEEVKKALQLDRKMIKGRPLYVSSVLRDKEKRQKFKYSDSLEPRKLFVKGVAYDATKEELESLFNPFGEVKEVRIVYHKSGKPKGIAYIEYKEESAASAAVLKLDQYDFKGFKLNIAISAPPPRRLKKEEKHLNKLLGIGRSRNLVIMGEQKPKMNLIPTAVYKHVASTSQTTMVNGKTNEDFRKLLNK